MDPFEQLASSADLIAKLALTVGGALVGAVVARVGARRHAEAQRARDARAHGQRVRQLEAARLEAIAELGRAATELAERALEDGCKAPRRAAVAPLLGAAPPWLPGFELHAPRQRELVLTADFGAAAQPPLRLVSGVDRAAAPSVGSPVDPAAAEPPRAPSRAESWSIPLAPLPRRERGAS